MPRHTYILRAYYGASMASKLVRPIGQEVGRYFAAQAITCVLGHICFWSGLTVQCISVLDQSFWLPAAKLCLVVRLLGLRQHVVISTACIVLEVVVWVVLQGSDLQCILL